MRGLKDPMSVLDLQKLVMAEDDEERGETLNPSNLSVLLCDNDPPR